MTSHGWKVGKREDGTHTQTPLLHQPRPSLPVSLPDSDRSPPGCGAAKTRPPQLPRWSARRSLFHLHLGARAQRSSGVAHTAEARARSAHRRGRRVPCQAGAGSAERGGGSPGHSGQCRPGADSAVPARARAPHLARRSPAGSEGTRLPFLKGIAEAAPAGPAWDSKAGRRPSASPSTRGRLQPPGAGRGRGKGTYLGKAGRVTHGGGTRRGGKRGAGRALAETA